MTPLAFIAPTAFYLVMLSIGTFFARNTYFITLFFKVVSARLLAIKMSYKTEYIHL